MLGQHIWGLCPSDKTVMKVQRSGDCCRARKAHEEMLASVSSDWQRKIIDILGKMGDDQDNYEIECEGKHISVLPDVYSPRYFTDSLWFAKELPKFVGRGSLLEIGTGTGIIAIFCAAAGATVVATDINPAAVRNARLNAETNDVQIFVRQGDLYDPIDADEKFDVIFWNHPFHNARVLVTDILLRAAFDYQYEGLSRYIRHAAAHLSRDGKLLLGTGDRADLDTLRATAEENGYSISVLREEEMPLENENSADRNSYRICQFQKK
jgi:release factor glutamine methyltransferase